MVCPTFGNAVYFASRIFISIKWHLEKLAFSNFFECADEL